MARRVFVPIFQPRIFMPNRIIRSGILTSEKVNALSLESEVFYRRLMSIVDDYGRCEAHPAMLRAALYPLRIEKVREVAINRMLAETVTIGLVKTYTVGVKVYLEIINFEQQKRSASKCPGPDDAGPDSQKEPLPSTCAAVATQIPADATQDISSAAHVPAVAHLGVSVSGGVSVSVSGGEGGKPPARPKDVEDVKAYAKELNLPEIEASKFLDHFQANGWRQKGGNAIKDWRAALRNWARRAGQFSAMGRSGRATQEKSSSGAPGRPFDASKPNAHTGGVPVYS